MPNTTNNNWPTPADTDLVKNGADAIRDLGNAIDTTLGVYAPVTPGLVKLQTVTFSGVTSQSVNDVFSSTYDNYLILFNYFANGGNSSFRLRASGTDNSNSNYISRGVSDSDAAVSTTRANAQTSAGLQTVSTSANFGARHVMQILGPNLNGATSIYTQTMYSTTTSSGEGYYLRATLREAYQATGFTLINGANMTGSLSVYGYAK
jgi:hypothetical protein